MRDSSIWGVVIAGGSGTRFWPLSTPAHPKQFLPLVTDQPLLADTVARFAPMIPPERIVIVTGAKFTDEAQRAAPSVPAENILGEPRAAGTAAALAWAAQFIARRDAGAVLCCVHADWSIGDPKRFLAALRDASEVAVARQVLVTVGIVPSRPDPGFGYIIPGDPIDYLARKVSRFQEKPNRELAATLIDQGALWNSGIFVWQAAQFLGEVRALTPELTDALAAPAGDAAGFFAAVRTPISVDVGVLERSRNVAVIPGDFGWDDIGTWAALRRVRALDTWGNATHGDTVLRDAHDNIVHGLHGTVVLFGVDHLVVVVKEGLTMVTTVDRAADLKSLIDGLPPRLRDEP